MWHTLIIAIFILGVTTATIPSKIHPNLLEIYQKDPSAAVNIFVEMRESNEHILRNIDSTNFPSRTEKLNTMKADLESLVETSQEGVRSILEESKADFIPFWINNRVFVRAATVELVAKLDEDPEVSLIRFEEIYRLRPNEEIASKIPKKTNKTLDYNWGIQKIGAPQAWDMDGGNQGEGVVVAIIDSGVRHTHVDLRNNFREDHGWFDPIYFNPTPSDVLGIGTILAGLIVGQNGIGVAPRAKWVSCRGCDENSCDESALTWCGQWIVCPTLANGEDPDCSMAPHVSSNSWGRRIDGDAVSGYLDVINAWHSAGIIPIFGIGEGGPECGSTMSPGDLANVIGVGATLESDTISSTSSRGPAANGLLKPDIVAPGVATSSSHQGDNEYGIGLGAGVGGAHAAGAVALLLSRNLSLSFEQVKKLLQANTDVELGEAEDCGGSLPPYLPNNVYGFGRLNVYKAMESLLQGSECCKSTASNSTFVFNINLTICLNLLFVCSFFISLSK